MKYVTIPTARGDLPGYLATPTGDGPWPGVVVIFDIGGMSQDLRNQADWLAGAGYLALVPDLYRGKSWAACIWSVMRDARARRGKTLDDLDTVRTWLAHSDGCNGKTGVIGFCMGGDSRSFSLPGMGAQRRASTTVGRPRMPSACWREPVRS